MKFASLLYHDMLQPDVMKGTPLCMAQFKHIFGTSRIPVRDARDYIMTDPRSKHVVVMCRGQMYYFQALNSDGSVGLDELRVRRILSAIMSNADGLDDSRLYTKAVGTLTTLDRSKWAATRERLISHSVHNASTLAIVDSALFVLVLDDFAPRDIHEAAANVLHGTYELKHSEDVGDHQAGTALNRWYDKLQLIVMKDGSAGVNFEHSAIDGHTALRYVSDIFADTVVSFAQSITKTIYSKDHVPSILCAEVKADEGLDSTPVRLEFELPADALEQIHYSETMLGDQLLQSDTYVLEFRRYGKSFITSNNMSPDSFVQMSILLAYYKLYGSYACAYEPVLTKRFLRGRTEAMRSAISLGKPFVECWCDEGARDQEKISRLREAVGEHARLVKEAAAGKGVDRHLFSLMSIGAKCGMETPSLFLDDGWVTLNHTILSTSNCGNPSLRLFGFGPVVPSGYGIGYIIRDGGLQFSISSKRRQTARFASTLRGYLNECANVLGGEHKIEVRGEVKRGENAGGSKETPNINRGSGSASGSSECKEDGKEGEKTVYAEGFDDFWGENVLKDFGKGDKGEGNRRRRKFCEYHYYCCPIKSRKSVRFKRMI